MEGRASHYEIKSFSDQVRIDRFIMGALDLV